MEMYVMLTMFAAFGQVTSELVPLNMLAFIPKSGNEPKRGEMCQAAMQVAFDAANRRNDILPGFHLQAVFEDEGTHGGETLNKMRKTIIGDKTNSLAPVIIGTYFSGGCQHLGTVLHHVNKVAVATNCGGELTTTNNRLPNLYRSRATSELAGYAIVRFIIAIGKWKQVALIGKVDDSNDFGDTLKLYHLLIDNGISVRWLEAIYDVKKENVESLIESNFRVIVVQITTTIDLINFYCKAYRHGLRGGRYVFLARMAAAFDANYFVTMMTEGGCTEDEIEQQVAITFFVGGFLFGTGNNRGATDLGYDLGGFESAFANLTNGILTADYLDRHLCHDAALQAILTLDSANKALLSEQNMTLRDYADNQGMVMTYVNKSAAAIEYTSLRVGKKRYSKRLEFDDEPLGVFRWDDDANVFHLVFEITRSEGSDLHDVASYKIVWTGTDIWFNEKTLPADYPQMIVVSGTSKAFCHFVAILSGIIALSHVGLMISAAFDSIVAKLSRLNNCTTLFALILLDVSVMCFVEKPVSVVDGTSLCIVAFSLRTVALSAVNGHLFARIIGFRNKMATIGATKGNQSPLNKTMSRFLEAEPLYSIFIPVLFCLLNGALLIVRFQIETGFFQDVHTEPVLDMNADVLVSIDYATCLTDKTELWSLGLTALQLVILICALGCVYGMRHHAIFANYQQVRMYSASALNSFVLLVAELLIEEITFGKPNNDSIMAVIMVAYSGSVGFICFWKYVKSAAVALMKQCRFLKKVPTPPQSTQRVLQHPYKF